LLVGALEGLGNVQRIHGRYADAERVLRQALAIAEDRLGDDDLQVAGVLNALAITFKYSGRFDDAAELYRRALAIIESALGGEHPDASPSTTSPRSRTGPGRELRASVSSARHRRAS
jgi:tetratricopeptide (TPR) repeat protein